MIEHEKHIEEAGLFYEQCELPKMAGRILGFLLCSEREHNFEQIKEAFKVSKGSISRVIPRWLIAQ